VNNVFSNVVKRNRNFIFCRCWSLARTCRLHKDHQRRKKFRHIFATFHDSFTKERKRFLRVDLSNVFALLI